MKKLQNASYFKARLRFTLEKQGFTEPFNIAGRAMLSSLEKRLL
jgi:hypothetical protein